MNILKFECPGCGQNLECDPSMGGDVIHCPRCCAELRIPFGGSAELPGTIKRAELILHASGASPAAPAVPPPAPAASESPPKPAAPTHQTTEILCPVCQSELRVNSGPSKAGNTPPIAELVHKGEAHKALPAPPEEKKEQHPDLDHMTIEERERHIAAAREAHPIQLNPPIKPRLSYVLSGEAPLPGKETPDKHESAEPPKPQDPPNTFTE